MTLDVASPADPEHYDGEVNEQVLPPRVWEKLLMLYRHSHHGDHRGVWIERFAAYMQAVPDMSGFSDEDLLERIKETA